MTPTSTTLLAAAAAALLAAGGALAQTPDAVFVPAKDLNAKVETLVNGLASAPVPTGPGATVLIAHRDRDGEVELHTHLADELIIREGHARIRIGGTASGQRNTEPGEYRGGTMTGFKTYDLAPGDVIWIAPNTPHQMLVKSGTQLRYMAVKFEAAK